MNQDPFISLELDTDLTDFRLYTDASGRHYAVLRVHVDELQRALDRELAAEEKVQVRTKAPTLPAHVDGKATAGYTSDSYLSVASSATEGERVS